jgi:hypothetical protein
MLLISLATPSAYAFQQMTGTIDAGNGKKIFTCGPSLFDSDIRLFHKEPDNNGIDYEIWCIRGIISHNMVLIISRPDGNVTVGGCFFYGGLNQHDARLDNEGNFERFSWDNEDNDSGDRYRFDYDVRTNTITVVKQIDGRTTKIGPIQAPKTLEELQRIIEDPPVTSCWTEVDDHILGLNPPVGNLSITVRDFLTGDISPNVLIQVQNYDWQLASFTDSNGQLSIPLESGEYNVTATVMAFGLSITSTPEKLIYLNGSKSLEFSIDTSALATNATLASEDLVVGKLNTTSKTLTFFTNSSMNNNVLTMTLPRSVIDTTMGHTDIDFVVQLNGHEVPYMDVMTDDEKRVISIPLDIGSNIVEVKGTHVIPEFRAILIILMLTISFSAIIMWGKVSRYF